MPLTRRNFIKYIAGAATSLLASFPAFAQKPGRKKVQKKTAEVVIVKRAGVLTSSGIVSSKEVSRMLADGICRITGRQNSSDAWAGIFSPSETIGIKVNALGGRKICTHPELAYAVADQLIKAGIAPKNIIIWDRLTSELEKAGYKIERGGSSVRCFGTDNDYEYNPEFSGTIGSCFSRILTRKCDAVISMPVLKDHDLAGVSLNLKNFYGAIHNPNKYHDNGCDPYIADLNSHRHIRNKLRLVIIDGLIGQYNGGPAFKSQWSWPYKGLLLSQDPVAVDLVGTQVIEKQRELQGLPSLKKAGRYPGHIQTAAKRNLGTGDEKRITKIMI